MATFDNPAVDADEAAEALRALAHASRVLTDPGDTYRVLGSLSAALASLSNPWTSSPIGMTGTRTTPPPTTATVRPAAGTRWRPVSICVTRPAGCSKRTGR